MPWANDYWLSPKSVVRDMVETASDFTGYIARYNIARSEGTLLRYLSDAYRTLARTVPPEKRDEQLEDIISWLRVLVRSIDSSLVDEWENAGDSADQSEAAASLAAPGAKSAVVEDRRGLTVLVRNALFRRVQLMDLDQPDKLGALDKDWGYGVHEWEDVLDDYYDEHEYVASVPKRARPNSSCWTASMRTTNTRGRCVRLSMIPTVITTGPSKASWISTPPKTPVR